MRRGRSNRKGRGVPNFLKSYVRTVETVNYYVGRVAMYLLFVLMAILLWSIISKAFFQGADWVRAMPFNSFASQLLRGVWTLEMAQFTMVAFYFLGGPYALQMGSNVRMDLFYGDWSPRTRAWVDAFTVFFLIFYLGVLLYGGISSTQYSLEYGERSATAWRPYMWPIKIIMCVAVVLMLLQAVALFIKDIAKLRGEDIPGPAELKGQVE